MRNLVVCFILVLVYSTGFGQTDEVQNTDQPVVGPWTIGGNFRFQTGNQNQFNFLTPFFLSDIDKSSLFQFSPVLTYGVTNRFSVNLILGAGFVNQKGSELIFLTQSGSITQKAEVKESVFSYGASVDRYMVLKKLWGFRLELGATFSHGNSAKTLKEESIGGVLFQESIQEIRSNNTGLFFTPNIDFFVGQRINLALNFGNISYLFQREKNGEGQELDSAWLFNSTISPDNVGLGIEFNF